MVDNQAWTGLSTHCSKTIIANKKMYTIKSLSVYAPRPHGHKIMSQDRKYKIHRFFPTLCLYKKKPNLL